MTAVTLTSHKVAGGIRNITSVQGKTSNNTTCCRIKNGFELKIVKVKVGNNQEMARSERNSHSRNRGVKKLN